VTDAVHSKGGKIFVQLMHTGRISHPFNLPVGAEVVAPSAIAAANSPMYTDQAGMQALPVPRALRTDEIPDLIYQFVHSAKASIAAGFDGVELHGANGYLLDQFLNPASNRREDAYGGSPERRNRFVVELASAVANTIGAEKTGIRLSPFGAFGEMISDENTETQFVALAKSLGEIGLAYSHLVDHSSMGAAAVPQSVKDGIRTAFGGPIILSGGYDAARAEMDLSAGKGELVAFGRAYISNPDFVHRLAVGGDLAAADSNTFYTAGATGYTDYPAAAQNNKSRPILAMFSF
jgi:N-ethylmaleimide reductase